MQPVSGEPGATAVALSERSGGNDDVAGGERGSALGVRPDDHSHEPGAIIEHEPEPVGKRRRRLHDPAGELDSTALKCLGDPAGRGENRLGQDARPDDDDIGIGRSQHAQPIPLVERSAQPNHRPCRQLDGHRCLEVDRDSRGLVLDEPGQAVLEDAEPRREHAFDGDHGPIGKRPRALDREHRVGRG